MLCHFFRHGKCSHRNSISDCFRHRHDIRLHTHLLPCEIRTTPSHSALDFIQDQQNIIFITDFTNPVQEFRCGRIDTALSLDRLHDDRTCLFTYQCFHTVQIIECRKRNARQHRFKWFPVFFVSGYGNRSDASSVERIFHGDKFVTSALLLISIFPGCFQCSFHRFRSAVGEENTIHLGNSLQFFCCLSAGGIIVKIGSVEQFINL